MTHTEPPSSPGVLRRLALTFLQSAAGRYWNQMGDPRNRVRVSVLSGWGLITITGICGVLLLHSLYTGHAITSLPGKDAETAGAVARNILIFALVLVALIAAGTYFVLRHGVIRPVEDYRERIQRRITDVGQQQSSELAILTFGQQKRTEQLEAAMMDNELLREEKTQVQRSLSALERLIRSTYETITDRLIVTDSQGRIIEISPLTIDLVGVHRTRLLNEPFDQVVNLYDPFRENPLEYPIRDLAHDILQSAAAIPKMAHVLVVAPHGQQERILLTASAILDETGRSVGAFFRFESDTSVTDSKPGGPAMRAVKTDRVTGLPGREMFNSRMRELIELARLRKTEHVLMVVAIDNMHSIADTFGQRASEELLWNVTQVIQSDVGTGNQCYRISSDFIGIPFALTDLKSVEAIGRTLCAAVSGRIYAWREARYECTVSCGLVSVDSECEDVEPLMELANSAVSMAKSQGGNRVQVLTSEDPAIVKRRSDKQWVDWLLPRLESGAAHLISQSIVPLEASPDRLPMFEVFLRVEDDDGVWVTPGAFLQATERFGYSARVDLWVLQALLNEMTRNPELLEKHGCATINISGASMEHPDFANDVVQLISLSGVPGKRICFEIDEPFAVSRLSVVSSFIHSVQGTGARFALDRYKAAGGLDALRELPIHFLKMHESLVRRLTAERPNPIDRMFVGHLNELCHARQIMTVASGIEHQSALEALREARVDYGQGVLLNKFGPVMT